MIPTPANSRARKYICLWLGCIGLLVYAMILVGGATRLTDSGLSITRWQPLSGALPPMSETAWQEAFALYQQTGEYQLQNSAMSVSEFKYIYWWEWGHRQLGRVISIVFLLPFLIFWRLRLFSPLMVQRLLLLFGMGAAQAVIGWWMVASGLGSDRTDVAAWRLMFHFGLALLIIGWCFWLILSLLWRDSWSGRASRLAMMLVALTFAQMLSGAMMAGLDGGMIHNDWPLMSGSVLAPDLFAAPIMENPALAQFIHRLLAYGLLILALVLAFRYRERLAILFLALVLLQAGLGIYTLFRSVPLHLGLVHQGLGVIVFLFSILLMRRSVALDIVDGRV